MGSPSALFESLYDPGSSRALSVGRQRVRESSARERQEEERQSGGAGGEGGRIDDGVVRDLVTHVLSPTQKITSSTRRVVSPDLVVSLPLFPVPEPTAHSVLANQLRAQVVAASQHALVLFRLPTLAVSLLPSISYDMHVFAVEETTLAVSIPEHPRHTPHKGKGKTRTESSHLDVVEKWSAEVEWTLKIDSPFSSKPVKGTTLLMFQSTTAPRKVELVFTSRRQSRGSTRSTSFERRRSAPPRLASDKEERFVPSSDDGEGEIDTTSPPSLVEKVGAEEHALELSYIRYSLPSSTIARLGRLYGLALVLAAWLLPLATALVRLVGLDRRLVLDAGPREAPHGAKRKGETGSLRAPAKRRKYPSGTSSVQLASTSADVGGEVPGPSEERPSHLVRHRRWSTSTASSSGASSATLTSPSPSTALAPPFEVAVASTLPAPFAVPLELAHEFVSSLRAVWAEVAVLLWTIRQAVLFVTELVEEGWGVAKEVLREGEGGRVRGAPEESDEETELRSAMSGGNGQKGHAALHKHVSFTSPSQLRTTPPLSASTSGTATPTPTTVRALAAETAAHARTLAPRYATIYSPTHGAPPEVLSGARHELALHAAEVAREAAPFLREKEEYGAARRDEALVGPHWRAGEEAARRGRRMSGSAEEREALRMLEEELEEKQRRAEERASEIEAVVEVEEQTRAHDAAAREAADVARRTSGTAHELATLAALDERAHAAWLAAESAALPPVGTSHLLPHAHLPVPPRLAGGNDTPTGAESSGRLSPFSALSRGMPPPPPPPHARRLAARLHALGPGQRRPRGEGLDTPIATPVKGGVEKMLGREMVPAPEQGQQEQRELERTEEHAQEPEPEPEIAGSTTDTSAAPSAIKAKLRYASALEAGGGEQPPISAPQKLEVEQLPTPPVQEVPSASSRLPPSVLERERREAQEVKLQEVGEPSQPRVEEEEPGVPSSAEAPIERAGPEPGPSQAPLHAGTPGAPARRTPSPVAHPSKSPSLSALGPQSVFAPAFHHVGPAPNWSETELQAAGLVVESPEPERITGPVEEGVHEVEHAASEGGKKKKKKRGKKGPKGAGG